MQAPLSLPPYVAQIHSAPILCAEPRPQLDPDMVLERWDKTAKVHFDRRVLSKLCSLRFVEARRNVAVLGPVGVGKTFLASALGHLACQCGFRVRFQRADALLRLLRQSRLANSSNRDTAEWIAVFDDALLGPSAVDRFKNSAYDLVIDGELTALGFKPNVDRDRPPPEAPVQKPKHSKRADRGQTSGVLRTPPDSTERDTLRHHPHRSSDHHPAP